MIANLFSKTKPLNYLLALILLFLVLLIRLLIQTPSNASGPYILEEIGLFVLLLALVFLNDFICIKNDLVRNNNYALFFFISFLLFFPSFYFNRDAIIALFLILLATRRILSMQAAARTKEKIFDASFWIFVATVFHFWSILYILVVFFAILLYAFNDYRNWFIPILSLAAVAILLGLINDFTAGFVLNSLLNKAQTSFDFSVFDSVFQQLALAVFCSINFFFFITYIIGIPQKSLYAQSAHKIILFSFLISCSIYCVSVAKNEGSLVFTFSSLAIMGANFIEKTEDQRISNTVMYSVFAIGLLFFILQL